MPSCWRNCSRSAPDIRQSGAPITADRRMRARMNHKLWQTGIAVVLLATLTGCVNQQEQTKRDIQKFMSYVAGEYVSQAGDTLVVAPVYARMVAMDTVYVERTSGQGTSGRLIELAPGKNGTILQVAYSFTQQGQWRNLRE